MSRELQIGSEIYEYPDNNESSSWGPDASDWAEAITDKINSISGNFDILQSSSSLADNTASDTNITGLSFSSSLVRAAEITFYIARTGKEYGKLLVSYNGSSWDIIQTDTIGDEGILFNITSAGQVQYQSTSTGTGATIYFFARSLSV